MPPLTTDRQRRDDLAALRRRKEASEAAAGDGKTPPAPQSAEAARGLVGGLITTGSDQSTAAVDTPTEPTTTSRSHAPASPTKGEQVDELVRRVISATPQDSTTSPTIQQRRPKGTADLARAAAQPRRRGSRSRGHTTEASRGRAQPKLPARRWTAAAGVLAAIIAVLAITLTSGNDRHTGPRSADTPTSNATLITPQARALNGALRAAIAAIAPDVPALTRHIA